MRGHWIAVGCAVAIAGCGGDPLTTRELTARADAICEDHSEALRNLLNRGRRVLDRGGLREALWALGGCDRGTARRSCRARPPGRRASLRALSRPAEPKCRRLGRGGRRGFPPGH